MNLSRYSPVSWSNESQSQVVSFEMTSAQALRSTIENVNCLLSILTNPLDSTALRNGKQHVDLTYSEHQKVARHVSEASRSLSKLALDYNVYSATSPMLKGDEDFRICTPQTKELVSSFNSIKDDSESSFPKEASLYVKQTIEIEPPVDSENIAIGRTFATLEEARDAFKDYAFLCGFNVCKGNSKKDIYQEYACSSRGKVRMRKVHDPTKRRNRKSIKKMCKCHIILRKKGQQWVITTRKLQHTHELLSPQEIKNTAKNRFIPESVRQKALELYCGGEAPAKIQYMFETELGDNCTWSMKDLYNMLYRYKKEV